MIPGIFLGYGLIVGGIWQETFWLRIWKIWKSWTHQKFILEESTRKKEWEHNKGDEFIFPVTDGTAKLLGRDYDFRDSTLRQEHTVRSEDFSKANLESLNRQNQQMTLEPGPTGRFKVTSSIVITMNLEFNCVPKEETFPTPLKYIDVTRSTHTDLDVMQEKRVDDCWNVDSNRSLSDSRKGFTKSTLLNEKLPKRYMWCARRLTKVQMTTRPAHVWPEVWSKIGKAAQNRGKQAWENEMPKLDNARRLGGINFNDPDGQDYKETPKNARIKLGRPMDAAMPRKKGDSHSQQETGSGRDCISQGSKNHLWLYGEPPRIHKATSGAFSTCREHEDHIAGKGFTSMTHSNL